MWSPHDPNGSFPTDPTSAAPAGWIDKVLSITIEHTDAGQDLEVRLRTRICVFIACAAHLLMFLIYYVFLT